jgi:hypothetical protein
MNKTNVATAYYNKFSAKLLKDLVSGNPRTESAICFACDQLKKTDPPKVLDLGFGLGWSTYEYSRALPNSQIAGIDLSPELTKLASMMFGDQTRIAFQCQDLTEQLWARNSINQYSACTMLDVYEHVPRPERTDFHSALSNVLTEKAILVLSCPTPLHQQYLREKNPAGLQPVDEDVTFEDILILADQIGGAVIHLEHKSIWATNDYFHAVISRQLQRATVTGKILEHRLISRSERMRRLSRAAEVVGPAAIKSIKNCLPSLARRAFDRMRNA